MLRDGIVIVVVVPEERWAVAEGVIVDVMAVDRKSGSVGFDKDTRVENAIANTVVRHSRLLRSCTVEGVPCLSIDEEESPVMTVVDVRDHEWAADVAAELIAIQPRRRGVHF